MTDIDVLEAEAIIGDEADKFLRSDLGQTMLGLAKQEADAATLKLKTADPDDTKEIRNLQNMIWRAESFEEWLRSLAHNGEIAMQTMELDEVDE